MYNQFSEHTHTHKRGDSERQREGAVDKFQDCVSDRLVTYIDRLMTRNIKQRDATT